MMFRVREGKILVKVSTTHEPSGSNLEKAQGGYEIIPKSLTVLSAMSKPVSGAAIDVEAPLITEGMRRDVLLRALQKRIYFEKTVAVSMAPNNAKHCTVALPSWFVKEHGDKVRQSVLLRSGSSTEPWRVQLSISILPPFSRSEVKLSSGWRAFAAANGLVVGDSLIFGLRAMSEFDVYVFREAKSPIPAPRKRSRDFKLSNEKANKSVGCKRRNLVVEGSAGGVISKILEKDKARTGSRVIKGIQEWQGTNFFEKILTAGAVSKAFQLTLPSGFMQQYGDKIRKHVVLRSVADRKEWTVKVYVNYPAKRPQFIFDGGAWKAFIVSNGLVIGDRMTFTLVAMSTFEVLILRSRGNPNVVRPSVQEPVIRSKDSAFSPTCQPATESCEPQHVDLTGKSNVKMERESSSEPLAEKDDSVDSVAYSASDSSPRKRSKDSKLLKARVNKSVGRRSSVVERSAGRMISEILEEANLARAGSRVNKGMQDWRGKNFFEKTLTACAVSKSFQLTLPTSFMHQYADKIREHVVLHSVADGEIWTLKVNIHFPDGRPQFILDCGNWKAFVVSNGLVGGDGLKFTLVAMSKFEVLILSSGGSPKAVQPSVQQPIIRSKDSAFSPTCQPATKSLGPQHANLTGESNVKMRRQLSSELFAEEEDAKDSDAYSASDSSQSPSDMDCHIFERWYEGIE